MRVTIEYDENEKHMASWIHLKCAEAFGNHPDIITKQYDKKITFSNLFIIEQGGSYRENEPIYGEGVYDH